MKAEVNGLNEKLVELLIKQGKYVSTAESCTGGLLSALITDVSGSSAVLEECIVTYSNAAKMRELGVAAQTLEAHGAVSVETAREMCEGICKHTGADVGIGITGIAGPTGGTEDKPVGTVCIGVCVDGRIEATREHFDGGRDEVRESSCIFALNRAIEMLEGRQ